MEDGEDLSELLWKNGELVSLPWKTAIEEEEEEAIRELSARQAREGEDVANDLFVQEDEIATWLNSPLDYFSDLYSDTGNPQPRAISDLASSSKVVSDAPTAELNYPIQPPPMITSPTGEPLIRQEFSQFSSYGAGSGKETAETSGVKKAVKESTVAESIKMPAAAVVPKYRVSPSTVAGTSFAAGIMANDLTGLGASVGTKAADSNLKRRGIQIENYDSEGIAVVESDLDLQNKALIISSPSSKRARCAEVHSLSEKKRRERINEKMKILQGLLPRTNKLDKASLLDATVEYLKSLQLQLQMLYMWYKQNGIQTPLFPGFQKYIPTMNMGMTSWPLMPFPQVYPGFDFLNSVQTGPRYPNWPATSFQMPPITISDPSTDQTISPPETSTTLNTTTMAVGSYNPQYYGVGPRPNIPSLPYKDHESDVYDQYMTKD